MTGKCLSCWGQFEHGECLAPRTLAICGVEKAVAALLQALQACYHGRGWWAWGLFLPNTTATSASGPNASLPSYAQQLF